MRAVERKTIKKIEADAFNSKQLEQLLCEAASKGWDGVVSALLARGVDPNCSSENRGALFSAALLGRDHTQVVDLLLKAGADPKRDPDVVPECGVNSLPLLLAAGGSLDGHPGGRNPLLVAIVVRTKQDKALALIAAGANPNVADAEGTTALMHAAMNGRDQVFDALLDAGADYYVVDRTGRSALRYALEVICSATAATESEKRIAKRIVASIREKAPVQPEDEVLLDIVLGDEKSLTARLKSGLEANTFIAGSIGLLGVSSDSIRSQAEKEGIEAVTNFLSNNSPSAADSIAGGSTLLMWAVAAQQAKCVAALLACGAKPTLANQEGVSAVTLLDTVGSSERIRTLIHKAMPGK